MPERRGQWRGHASRPGTPLHLVVQYHILLLKYRRGELHMGARLLNGGRDPLQFPLRNAHKAYDGKVGILIARSNRGYNHRLDGRF